MYVCLLAVERAITKKVDYTQVISKHGKFSLTKLPNLLITGEKNIVNGTVHSADQKMQLFVQIKVLNMFQLFCMPCGKRVVEQVEDP